MARKTCGAAIVKIRPEAQEKLREGFSERPKDSAAFTRGNWPRRSSWRPGSGAAK